MIRIPLIFCLILFAFSKPGWTAVDHAALCKAGCQSAKTAMLQSLDEVENTYFRYRMLEFKIRYLTYQPLWEARRQGMDPLDKAARAAGQKEEKYLLEDLRALEQASKQSSNAVEKSLKGFLDFEEILKDCCPDRDVKNCFQTAFEPFIKKIDQAVLQFTRISEYEKGYRKNVDLTVGGRKGLYPDDTVEAPVQHKDYFARYEIQRRQRRHEEDVWMILFFQDLRKILTREFPGDDCCLRCGPVDWDKKVDRMFEARGI